MMPLSWEKRAGKKENAWPLSCLHTVVSAGTVLFYVFFSFFFLLQKSLGKILHLKWSIKGKKTMSDPILPPILQDGKLIDQHRPLYRCWEDFKSCRDHPPSPAVSVTGIVVVCSVDGVGAGWGILEEEDFLAPLKLYCKEKEFKERTEKGGK